MTQAQALPGGLMKIGTVAAMNIARALQMPDTSVKIIEHAIADEINAMSSHFTLAVADLQTQTELEIAKIKSTYSFVKDRLMYVLAAGLAIFVLGTFVGHFA